MKHAADFSFNTIMKVSPMKGRQDSKLGVEIAIPKGSYCVVETGPSEGDDLAKSPSESTFDHSCETRNEVKRVIPASRRAKKHLRRHGHDAFGRDYVFLPKSLTFDAATKVVLESCTGLGSHVRNAITQWMMEPVTTCEGDLSYVTTSVICNQMRDTLNNGGILFGIEEDAVLKTCLIFREVSDEKPNGPLKLYTDVLAQHFAIVPPVSLGTTLLDAEKRQRQAVGKYVSRSMHLEDALTEWHSVYSPQKPHWYLSELAVASNYQGKGFGKEIMSTFCKLADRYQMDVYMECGTNVTDFFLGFDFRELAVKEVCPSNEERCNPLEVSIMLRTPN